MSSIALALSAGGFTLTLGTWVAYMARVPGGRVPARPVGSIIAQLAGIGLGAAAIVWALRTESPGVVVFVLVGFSGVMAGLFLWLLTQRKTPVGNLQPKVGDTLLPLRALTSEGVEFTNDDLAGRRTLLKFFRGSW